MTDYTFDTKRIDPIVNELDAALHQITSTPVEVDDATGKARHNDPNKAEVSRLLLRAADLAAQLESEVRTQYWAFKGYDDPTNHDLTREA